MKWPADLKADVKTECSTYLRQAGDVNNVRTWTVDGILHCHLCPLKIFKLATHATGMRNLQRDLKNHIQKQHVNKEYGTPSTKLCRVIAATARHTRISCATKDLLEPGHAQRATPKYLQTAAAEMSQQLATSPSWQVEQDKMSKLSARLDRHTILLLDMEDTRFVLRSDATRYHKVSAQYVCTDKFLWHFLASLLHPTTKAASCRVISHLQDKCGWKGSLLPADRNIFKSLCETLFQHPQITAILANCREAVDKRLVKVDGQFSAFLSILFQAKHGARRQAIANAAAPNIHVALSILCGDGVLNVHPASSEKLENQITAINTGVGAGGKAELLAICSDSPGEMDKPKAYSEYENMRCVIKDPLHIPLKAEGAFNERQVDMTILMRRCAIKFKHGFDDGLPFFRKQVGGTGPSTLPAEMAAMTRASARRRINVINRAAYPEQPYTNAVHFVRDIAAILIVHARKAARRIKKSKTTVLQSLIFATKSENLGYLMNHTRFRARFPDVKPFYGTTANEGFNLQFKGYFRNIFHQTGRNAILVCKAITLAKLLVAKLRKDLPHTKLREHELLQTALQAMTQSSAEIAPRLIVRVRKNPAVNQQLLPDNVKRLRKRYAA